jgi:PKD repeat protein
MKKMLLFLACSVIMMANAQNNLNQQKHNKSKQTVREMALKKGPLFKQQLERAKVTRKVHSNGVQKSGNDRSGCFETYSYPNYTYLWDGSNDSTIVSWIWDYGDSSNVDTTLYSSTGHYYSVQNGGGLFYVCLTKVDSNGVSQTCCDSIYVADSSAYCYANFSYSIDTSSNVLFSDYSSSGDSIVSWGWDFGDNTGSVDQNPVHFYSAAGTYSVCLTINTSNGCTNSYCYSVNVNDYTTSCSAYFSYSGAFGSYNFSDYSSAGMGNVVSWAWDFGDSATSTMQNPTYTYTSPGLYYVCLTITTDSGCTSTYCDYVNNQVPSDLVVDTIANLEQTLSAVLFGSCVSVSNLTYVGAPSAVGYFMNSHAGTDSTFAYGLLLTNGSVYVAPGPNNSTGAGVDNGLPGDTDLDALVPGYTTYDASIIEFDFSSASDTIIASDIIFASEEYPEFVGSSYNDVFGFYISGPGITGTENLAIIPNTSDPISVNSVNPNQNSSYYNDNTNGITYQYDGRTSVISLRHSITPGATYHFKIAIADAGDHVYDSGVLIKAGSFNGNAQTPVADFTSNETSNLVVNFTNTSVNSNVYGWDFGDGSTSTLPNPTHTYTAPGTYTVLLVASNVCYSDTTTMIITVGANGIKNLSADNAFKIVPTVNEGVFNAYLNSSVNEKVQVKVFNISGQVVMNTAYSSIVGLNNFTLDLSGYAHGMYTVQVAGEKEMFTSRMIR